VIGASSGVGHVLVIGGGIAGMATAIALSRRGVAVDIVEADPEWRVYGAGITITGPTLRAFRDLGLLPAIEREGYLVRGQRMFLYDGTLLAEQDPPPIAPGLPTAGGIMRPKLHQIMSAEVLALGVNVRLGATLVDFTQDALGVSVTFSDGTSGRYELVVGADGIYSKTRKMLFKEPAVPTYTGQMSWRVVAPRPADMTRSEFFFGHSNIAGITPCSQTEVYAFVLHPEPTPSRVADADKPEFLRSLLADFGGSIAEIRDGIGPHSAIVQRPFEYALQAEPWHLGRFVLIGDAAHATTPHLASGAGIAVEDGLVLAEELEQEGRGLPAALAAFTKRRFERCRFVVESSVEIGRRQLEGAPPEEIGMRMGKAMHVLAGEI